MQKFKSRITKLESQVWYCCIPVPKKAAKSFVDGDRRIICSINNEVDFPAALMPDGKGGFFINTSKQLRKKLGIDIGDDVEVTIVKDESKYGMPMPEEMEELLKIDDEADKFFHQLTPGKQRSLLYLIGKPKSTDVRLKKAIVITEHLKTYRGKLDFKILNEDFKNYPY